MSVALPRLRRWLLGVLAAVVALLVIAAALGVWTVRRSFPDVSGEVALPGLSAPVTVHRDEYGITHLYADTPEDLFAAQGYVHAQDRFWAMDFNRHVTAGRLAELFGADQVPTDAYLRTMGWRRVAEAEYDLLDDDTRAYLTAYADGVNAYLDGRSNTEVSLEYAVLAATNGDYRIEPWTPVDSLAWLKAMAWDLVGNMDDEIARASLLAAGLTRQQVEELYPAYPEDTHEPIVAGGSVSDGEFTLASTEGAPAEVPDTAAVRALADLHAPLDAIPRTLGPASSELGSNSWVLSGEHTASGLPLLANDPHLGAVMPSIWYQMGLHCSSVDSSCPFDVTGFTFPGLPGVVIGANDTIAWGFTNLGPDVVDLYLEKIEGDAAIVDGEPEPLETRTETIEVAGGEDVEITVRSSRHGPLLSDPELGAQLRDFAEHAPVTADGAPAETRQDGDYAVAISWTALSPGRTAEAVFRLNRARSFEEFREAARSFEVPAQNLVYADTAGNIGYQAPGRIPVRGRGDGRWPAPGWDSAHDWKDYIPFEELPTVLNPDSGVIVTANQAVVDSGYPHLLTADWDYGYRSQRINTLLDEAVAEGDLTVDDMLALQMDNENTGARALVPHLLEVELDGTAERARRLLADWDFQQDVDSAAAAFYNATYRHLVPLVFDELGANPGIGASRAWLLLADLVADPESAWWHGAEADSREEALALAMERASEELTGLLGDDPAEWRWGDLHTLTARNASFGESGIAAVEWLFNRGPVAAGGGSSIVNATGWNPARGYEITTVPSMRMVVDLAEPDGSRWVNLTGNSGHAFHPHYDDQMELWAEGATTPMRMSRAAVEEAAEHTLVLRP
ncbi:penicillin acylase family protein [Thermobifida halotolerans]|uniref:Penicillin acylase family protein n=1 Tax=Thermobifida halotolerans TaxID=483545 RepID=A0A399G4W9_9ACTN|nr:penicillin acylase family protein [Thermobifida halotolerans]UOE20774.1 penicillin acylase family protein [Thermobifida halotolerans]